MNIGADEDRLQATDLRPETDDDDAHRPRSNIQDVAEELLSGVYGTFLLEQAALINFSEIEFLEQESFMDVAGGKRKAMDLVVRVGLKDGSEEFILVHTEFQARRDPDFAKRMYEYFSQLYLRYGKPIVPIVVFTDDAKWRKPVADTFDIRLGEEVYMHFKYHLIKLKHFDYRQFLESDNPLAFALMAKMDYKPSQRVRLKADFLRWILGIPIDPARRSLLVDFVETYVALNRKEEVEFDNFVQKPEYKEVEKMVTTYEKRGIEKGIEKGREEGMLDAKRETLAHLLEKRFGGLKKSSINKIQRVRSTKRLDSLILGVLDAESIEQLGL